MAAPAATMSPFDSGFGATLTSASLEEHAAHARGWTIEFRQLGRGRFTGGFEYALTADTQYALNHTTPGLWSTGLAPRGTVILAAQLDAAGKARFHGEPFPDGHVAILHPDEPFDLRVWGPGTTFTATLQPARLEAYLLAVLGRPLAALQVGQVLPSALGPGERRRLLARMGLDVVLGRPGLLRDPGVARQFEERLLDALCAGLCPPRERTRRTRSRAIALRADAFLRAHVDRPVTIAELCRETGATERTLHHAFQVHFGTSPKAMLKAVRLNAARRDLERGEPGTSVTGVAMRWGFFHPGWFSHDYHEMFERTPAETLRAARAAVAVSG
jgi:AraC family ethanolamine operon transcriptional activator